MSTSGPFSDILEAVGNTPLVKLRRIPQKYGIQCNIYAKLEYFNPGGSTKDRIALKMIERAEQSGQLRPGMTIIEPSWGNTGISLAMIAAVKGYKCIIVMPERVSDEKVHVLKALGARVHRCNDPDSFVSTAYRMRNELPDSVVLDQYKNPANPQAHFDGTGSEITEALDGKVDMVVVGVGTGGSITGIAKKVKSVNPSCVVVGVEPVGSLISCPAGRMARFHVEGIGQDLVPDNLDKSLVDEWIQVPDIDSFDMSRKAIGLDGILCGGSSGAVISASMHASKKLRNDQNCVIIVPDGARYYFSKFLSPDWMESMRFVVEDIPQHLSPSSHIDEEHSLLTSIGQSPLVKLHSIPQSLGVQCEIYAKCEFLSPSGSVEDRIALVLIQQAENSGKLMPGMTLIRPTTGKYDLGLATVSAVKGYKLILVTSAKMTEEKENLLKTLGVQVVYASKESQLSVSRCLNQEIQNSIVLDGPLNMSTIHRQIIQEILSTLKTVDLVVFEDSLYRLSANSDIVTMETGSKPPSERDSFEMTKRLIREEGFLCGLSSGASMLVASLSALCLSKEKRVVVVLPDGIGDYLMWLNGR